MSFTGEYINLIDQKNRLSIPAKFRNALGSDNDKTFVLSKGFDECLLLYPLNEWKIVEEQLSSLSSIKNKNRNFIRKIFPYYYSINLIILILVSVPIYVYHGMNFTLYLIYICCALFAVSLFILMPLINRFRDKKNKKKFKIAHTASVVINFVQIFLLIIMRIFSEKV